MIVLAAGALLFTWATSIAQYDLLMDAFVLVSLGCALYAGGTALAGVLLLPLAFVWIARPLPPVLVYHVHDALQDWGASFVELVLRPLDPVLRCAVILDFRARILQVVANCRKVHYAGQ